MTRSSLHIPSASKRALWSHFEAGRDTALAALLCKLARRGCADVLGAFQDHPLEDDWKDFAWQSLRTYFVKRKGVVYVVANPVNPGLYKVGQTKESLPERLKTLNSAGVVGYFVPVLAVQVHDRFEVEAAAQRHLAQTVPQHKEFFQCDWKTAMDAVNAAAAAESAALSELIASAT